MSAPASRAQYRPELKPDVLVTDALLLGDRTVHLIKDTGSGQSFKVGAREHFLISRMDGTRNLEEIGAEYARQYGRRLADANWQQLLRMLGARGLLAGAPAPAPAPDRAPAEAARSERRLLRGTLPLVADADATATRLHRAVRSLLSPWTMVPLLTLVAVMEIVAALHTGELVLATRETFTNPVLLTATGALLWLSTALHELAHGVVAKHYGGRVAEIGLRWRLPSVIMYCVVDNFLYLRTRWHRVATALAGAVANLLFLLPFFALWLLAPLDQATHDALAALLFLGSVQAFAMLVPLPPLDGYKVAAQLLGATELAASSSTYLRLALRRDPAAAGYPRRARIVYTAYGLGSLLVLGALAAAVAAVTHFLLTAP
ncbi:M50 family metallopeptidase [Streptomyces sp. TRM70350]|uniref:M50 family metallopeptidase n=1 Tax=Streptomyces sp. TRM70350 TaxID=2856165 RepID=UPI001C455D31|nr:M50 family metallopeptidase [Streptomyces sp. TRM70350]MBV7699476.1 M50 family metallopeptidase [Streptomyces sp. TRM70350]